MMFTRLDEVKKGSIPGGAVTTIIGPNGCGKSTLLRAAAQLISSSGSIMLDDVDVRSLRRKELAQRIGVLPQSPIAPPGVVVSDLVARGRHPHQSWFRQWSSDDEEEVARALELTHVADLADRPVSSLSGGQRQRVWISMVLAQDTEVLFLDEPTTYLDLSHSIEVLNLVTELKHRLGRTVVMVLHDLNLAARYSDNVIVMADGQVTAAGKPSEVLTEELLESSFGLDARVIEDPECADAPLVVPRKPEVLNSASKKTAVVFTPRRF
ncbi:ABC transporter ATP-binding protein [uncultured Corynebacterium sp.]|uniref:ABC transporter ATP-binding protein n=1 Tax=uncultured Corynebacterium sp. TaxID=159447 RepID=UPI002803875A|nr:ABC transporter ATP-binding protein [uncultured Corynebacterium sp.]